VAGPSRRQIVSEIQSQIDERTKTMKIRLAIAAGIVLFGTLVMTSTTWSESGTASSSSTSGTTTVSSSSNTSTDLASPKAEVSVELFEPSSHRVIKFKGKEFSGNARHIERLVNQLREADDKKKPELTKELETAVSASFDADMKDREGDLARLEQRLNKLRDQLDRRRKAKAEIIQLEVKVLTNEAAGLGFSELPARALRDELRHVIPRGEAEAMRKHYEQQFLREEKGRRIREEVLSRLRTRHNEER